MTTTEFPKVLNELSGWVNEGKAGEIDFEMYSEFNEQYRPSHWTGNEASDEEFLTFGTDGRGGQVAIWLVKDAPLDSLPIVFLGRDGELATLAPDLPGFMLLLASGVQPIQAATEKLEAKENQKMLKWVRKVYPEVNKPFDVNAIVSNAKKAHPQFEAHVNAQCKRS